jgi:glycosyltransferase involved in cell wall biosynthesis
MEQDKGDIVMSKRVLVITYYFPPRPDIASLRLRGLAKYLPEYGWEPVILTAALPGKPESCFKVVQTAYPGDATACWKRKLGLRPDKGFQEQIGVPRALRESEGSFTSKLLTLAKAIIAYPDEQKSWYPFAVSVGHDLLTRERFDALLSSSSPVTCHLIARELKRRHRIPWVADLRDLWTQNHHYPYGPVRRLFERRLEVKTLSAADALVTVSEPLAEKLRLLHRGKPVIAIPNGYDPDEVASASLTREFTITYTGQLYQGKRDPTPLFRAIAELISEGRLDRRVVKVRLYGATDYWVEKEVKRFGLEDVVRLSPYVPREIALEKQRESQILLLLNWNHPEETGVYTGKVFEYLAARRPILAVGGPRGVVTELLEETGAGFHALGYAQLKHALLELYEQYRTFGYVPYKGREEQIAKYSHVEMARRFAELLDFLKENKMSH